MSAGGRFEAAMSCRRTSSRSGSNGPGSIISSTLSAPLSSAPSSPRKTRRVFSEDHRRRSRFRRHSLETESTGRRVLRTIVESPYFDLSLGLVIIANLFVTVLETDEKMAGSVSDSVSYVFLSIYTCELCMKIFVQRLFFFKDVVNLLDMVIVVADALFVVVGNVLESSGGSIGHLRSFRLIRLLRVVRAIRAFRELNQLLHAFAGAVKAVVWGVTLIMIILTVYGVMAVQLIHPVVQRIAEERPEIYADCEHCITAYSSVFRAMMTFTFQCLANETWSNTFPIIDENPMMFLFFFSLVVTVQLIMLNLVLAVTMQAAMSSTIMDLEMEAQRVVGEQLEAESDMLEIASQLDRDGSGTLNEQEFIEGFKSNKEFQNSLGVLGVTEDDLHFVFKLCDTEETGSVDYEAFIVQLSRMKLGMDKLLLAEVMKQRTQIAGLHRGLMTSTDQLVQSLMNCLTSLPQAAGKHPDYVQVESLMTATETIRDSFQRDFSEGFDKRKSVKAARDDCTAAEAVLRKCNAVGGAPLTWDFDLSVLTLPPDLESSRPTPGENCAHYRHTRPVPTPPQVSQPPSATASGSLDSSIISCAPG
eukprot:TRINITY_DN11571_c0_g1_i1.p1 TRINITY_DN11571_c0_g1~~TRINITY_DN11571_c0_g1_i1.p1  ORF type:complete len:588 (+),score=81.45 TRINITY_DN11571_c0_g1_i1:113-1876(+)